MGAAPHDEADPQLAHLETARLRIRPLAMDDLAECHRLFREIGWTDASRTDAENLERRRTWLAWTIDCYREFGRLHQPRYGERAVVERESGRFVGLVGLTPSLVAMGQLGQGARPGARCSPEAGLFWAVLPEHQRKGYASEAAHAFLETMTRALHLGRMVATTEHDNGASIGVMRKLGMKLERNPFDDPPWLQVVGVWTADDPGVQR
jgi:RimJ/RimL family protein N-acetyltransferase